MMHPLVYVMLLASPCLGHYRFETRNLVERDELEKGEWVNCPVCDTPSYSALSSGEECQKMNDGRQAKRCLLGTYINHVCGSKRDCYRGPGEQCTEKLENDPFNQRCAPGWTCSGITGKCTGLGNHYDSGRITFLNPERYLLGNRQERL